MAVNVTVQEVLRRLAPFQTLDQAFLDEVSGEMYFKTYAEGEYVFRQGSPSLGVLFIVVEGLAEVSVTNERGAENVVGYRRLNDFFGETVILSGGTYSGSVLAKEPLTCLLIPRSAFEKLIYHDPNAAVYFSRGVIDRMRALYEEIVAEQSYEAYGRSDATLFRRQVGEVMSSPVITCRPSDPVMGVARVMSESNISAIVVIDDIGQPVGLITEKDLVAKAVATCLDVAHSPAGEVMNRNLVTLPPQAFLHQALLAVIKQGVKHLAVVDRGMLVGIVTLVDLVKARSTGTLWVAHRIEAQHSLAGLEETGREVDLLLSALVAEKAPVPALFEIMSELHDRLTRQVIALCEQEMVDEGYGPPPQPYCWLSLGSAGRREQTLRTDQDNAVVYADPPPDQAAAAADYFHRLGEKVVEGLARTGFTKCKGDTTASNPKWCRPLGDWCRVLDDWIRRVDPSGVRMLTIFLDFRHVYGDAALAQALWKQVFRSFQEPTPASHLLTQDEVRYKAPLGLRGSFITEKSGPHRDEIDLKSSAAVHIVNCIRIFAIKHGITKTSTLGRLQELVAQDVIDREDAEFIQASYETIMMFRIRENLRKYQQGLEPDDYINPHRLSKREQAALREALSVIGRLQKLTASHFNEFWRDYLTT
ncbi:MAG: DUF294 nucleotidyltransferase-like domain-containing protein [Bacillota bacterium]|nr:DUF294 nucleotidyltransferase-like domain-containing protein [Bacillota bacterium]